MTISKAKKIRSWKKQQEYKEMFNCLTEIGMRLAHDYPRKKKVFEALDIVGNFIGDRSSGRKL